MEIFLWLNKIDVQRLSGVRQLLGVDIEVEEIRVVELRRAGNPFRDDKARFRITKCCSERIIGERTPDRLAETLQNLIKQHALSCRLAVAQLGGASVKRIHVTMPREIDDTERWIEENSERFLRLPVAPEELAFAYEELEADGPDKILEIHFVRKGEIEKCLEVFRKSGLNLIQLSCGSREAINMFLIDDTHAGSSDYELTFPDGPHVDVMTVRGGKYRGTRSEIHEATEEEAAGTRIQGVDEIPALKKALIGRAPDNKDVLNVDSRIPLGLAPRFLLASGLAIKGFMPNLNPVNLLPDSLKREWEEKVFRSLFLRTVLCSGLIIFLALFLQFAAGMYVQSKQDQLETDLKELGPTYTEVTHLEGQVGSLERQLGGSTADVRRSSLAKVLHEIAACAPEEVRLQRLILEDNSSGKFRLTLSGSAKSDEGLAQFMRSLAQHDRFSEVNLVRTGLPRSARVQVGSSNDESITFEIKSTVSPG